MIYIHAIECAIFVFFFSFQKEMWKKVWHLNHCYKRYNTNLQNNINKEIIHVYRKFCNSAGSVRGNLIFFSFTFEFILLFYSIIFFPYFFSFVIWNKYFFDSEMMTFYQIKEIEFSWSMLLAGWLIGWTEKPKSISICNIMMFFFYILFHSNPFEIQRLHEKLSCYRHFQCKSTMWCIYSQFCIWLLGLTVKIEVSNWLI